MHYCSPATDVIFGEHCSLWCPGESRYASLWCTVCSGEQTMGAQVVISNISRLADQVQAPNCAVMGSNPRAGPSHYLEVRSDLHF